jgi:hypothetical protein
LDCIDKKGDRNEPEAIGTVIAKIFATKALRHKGYIYDSFFVPWCISGRMEKCCHTKTQK